MSADNGVYILKCKDQYRVRVLKGIEYLYYDREDGYLDHPSPQKIAELFGGGSYTKDANVAIGVALSMLSGISPCEYGIRVLAVNQSWEKILNHSLPMFKFL